MTIHHTQILPMTRNSSTPKAATLFTFAQLLRIRQFFPILMKIYLSRGLILALPYPFELFRKGSRTAETTICRPLPMYSVSFSLLWHLTLTAMQEVETVISIWLIMGSTELRGIKVIWLGYHSRRAYFKPEGLTSKHLYSALLLWLCSQHSSLSQLSGLLAAMGSIQKQSCFGRSCPYLSQQPQGCPVCHGWQVPRSGLGLVWVQRSLES